MTQGKNAVQVGSREELVVFIESLVEDFRSNPEKWENGNLERFLEAMAGWVDDMEGYYANTGEDMLELPPWRLLADILQAAKSYE